MCQCYDKSPSVCIRDRSSWITSSMFRMDSPRMTFCTSSASRVSCSTSALASYDTATNGNQAKVTSGHSQPVRRCRGSKKKERTRCSSSALDLRSVVTRDSPSISRLEGKERAQ